MFVIVVRFSFCGRQLQLVCMHASTFEREIAFVVLSNRRTEGNRV